MNAIEKTIAKILTEQICYEIPPYQRSYSWEKGNVQQMLEDIWEAYEGKDSEYFIGSLITIERERDLRYEAVDGQQRLTTLNLIFASLRSLITDQASKVVLGQRILPTNPLTGITETPRLLLRKKDRAFFRKYILEGQPISEKDRVDLELPQLRLAENLTIVNAFCAGKEQQTLKNFAEYILTKVYVVFVNTNSLQSAHRLFNVLNARGMPLSNADLIKNTLFSLIGSAQGKTEELEENWLGLENELGIERLDTFLGHHRTSVTAVKARGTLHEEFEPLIQKAEGGAISFLEQVMTSAENYSRIMEGSFVNPETLRALRALQRVEYDEWIPPLLAYLNQPIASLPEFEFVSLLERITMQNWVRRLGRTARLTVYYQLINAIRGNESGEVIRQIIRKNAQNDEFFTLLGGDIYGKPFDAAVLLRLEEAAQDESVTKSFGGRLTIEHVLPQALKDEYWIKRFTPEAHTRWLHRLGNIALLCGHKNYKAQYYDFSRKKKIYADRNKKVSFDLTKEVCDVEEWTEEAIKQRHERLLKLAKEIWIIT
ncbi:MAG TPA: DUF262 domain-containing protein [Gemmata sp.]|jgi:hypothetical protein|nr:DUF262 domain-containing protein [Gemmata sp.]